MLLGNLKANNSIGIPLSVLFVFFVPGHMFDWAIEWTWLGIQLVIALFWFCVLQQKFQPTAGLNPTTWLMCFTLFTASGMLGTLYSSLIMNLQIDGKDIQDLSRFLISIPLALFIGSAIKEHNIDGFTKAIKMVISFHLLTSAILLFDISNLSNVVMLIYADAKVQYDFGHIRIGIPFTNPNFAALFFVLAFSYFTFFKKSPIFAALSIISLFLTGSRSGLISAAPILILSYLYFLRNALSSRRILSIFIISHAIPLYYIATLLEASEDFSRIVELIEALRDGDIGQVDTASIRLDLVNSAIEYIKLSPVFGIGPGRSYGLDVTDSQLIAWPLMYGIPSAILISGFFAIIFLNIARGARTGNHIAGAVTTCFSFFLMLSVGDFMKNYRLFFITILFAHTMKLIAVNDAFKWQHISINFSPRSANPA